MGNTDSTEAAAAGTYRGVDDHTVQELVQQFAEHLSEKFDIDVNQVLDVDVRLCERHQIRPDSVSLTPNL